MENPAGTVHDAVGGQAFFDDLVGHFYAAVAEDPLLRPLYPEADLGPAADRLAGFLAQYFGGPPLYSEARGHPRLRMRHAPYVIGAAERDAWLEHMLAAVEHMGPPPEIAELMRDYFVMAAEHMVNADA